MDIGRSIAMLEQGSRQAFQISHWRNRYSRSRDDLSAMFGCSSLHQIQSPVFEIDRRIRILHSVFGSNSIILRVHGARDRFVSFIKCLVWWPMLVWKPFNLSWTSWICFLLFISAYRPKTVPVYAICRFQTLSIGLVVVWFKLPGVIARQFFV